MPRKPKPTTELGTASWKPRNTGEYHMLEKMRTLATLAAVNGNLREASRQTGVPPTTIDYWARTAMPDIYQKYQDTMVNLVAEVMAKPIAEYNVKFIPQALEAADKYLKHISQDEVIEKTSARDAAVILGILMDKVNQALGLDKSKPTQQTVSNTLNINVADLPEEFKKRVGDIFVEGNYKELPEAKNEEVS